MVSVLCEVQQGRRYVRDLTAWGQTLMRASGLAGRELSVVLTGDRQIRRLNRSWRGKDSATDVLAFSQLEEAARSGRPGRMPKGMKPGQAGASYLIGDVIIAIDTARRQAMAAEISVATRLRTLLIHGFLHLLGYDHERSERQARLMEARARELEALFEREPRRSPL